MAVAIFEKWFFQDNETGFNGLTLEVVYSAVSKHVQISSERVI
jgi:hypothetical protein